MNTLSRISWGLRGGGFSRLGLKTGKTEDEAAPLVLEAVDLGINFIDTAAAYGTEGIHRPIPMAASSPPGKSWFAIAAAPATRIAILNTVARRRFGSSQSIATKRKAATRMIAEA
jgi:hypothetical protein